MVGLISRKYFLKNEFMHWWLYIIPSPIFYGKLTNSSNLLEHINWQKTTKDLMSLENIRQLIRHQEENIRVVLISFS